MSHLEAILLVHLLKAQQKMPSALRRTNNNIRQVSNGGSRSRLRNTLEQRNHRDSSQAHDVSALLWMNSEQRFAIFTVVTLDNGTELRVLVPIDLPQGSAERNTGSEANIDMDGPSTSIQASPPMNQGNASTSSDSSALIPDDSNQGNASTSSDSSALIPDDSNEGNASTSSDSSALIPDDSSPSSSAEHVRDMCIGDKAVKENNKKKNKKRKKNKKSSSSAEPSDLAVSCAEVVHGAVTTENSSSNGKHPGSPQMVISYSEVVASERVASVSEELRSDDSISTANGTEAAEHVLSTCKEVAEINQNNDISSENFSDAHSTLFADSVSDEWNSYESTNASDDIEEQSSVKEGYVTSPSEKSECTNDGFSDGPGTRCSSSNLLKDGTSNDLHSGLPGEVGRQDRKLSGSSDDVRIVGSGGNIPGYIGKENSYSIWQKVQKDDADKSVKSNDDSSPEAKVSENSKSKQSTGTKQEFNYYSRKGSNASKTYLARAAKTKVEEKESLVVSTQLNHQKGFSTGLSLTGMIDYSPSKPVPNSQICNERTLGSVCTSVSGSNSKAAHFPVGNGPKQEMEVAGTNRDNNSESVSQKWIPVVRKDASCETGKSRSNLLVSSLNETDFKGLALKKNDKEQLGANSHNLVPPPGHGRQESYVHEMVSKGMSLKDIGKKQLNPNSPSFVPLKYAVVPGVRLKSANLNSASPRDEGQVAKLSFNNICTMEEQTGKHANISEMEINLNKITDAVSDANRLEMASTCIQQATGSSLAEFEKLLHLASPVLGGHLQDCQSCSSDHIIGSPLYRNEIPDISLGNIWKWYDKLGSYGLGVKVENHLKPNIRGVERFSAFFVPYLSAIQLFGNPQNLSGNPRNHSRCSSGSPSVEVLKASDFKKSSQKSSDISHLPISSVLLPQRRGKSKTLASGEEEISERSLRTAQMNDSELLFEYFDSELPFQRPPLFDKIQELSKGDGFQNCITYGNPQLLEYLNLRNLHPGSWYSVAWYPIYRIPEGNLRAAFLTYHSLGHFTPRQTLSASSGGNTCIVCPVVGLQSYNAEAECWFELKPSLVANKEETLKYNRMEILRDRLKSLEKTASVMARAVVNKGKEKERSVNHQRDYEFFLSRRR